VLEGAVATLWQTAAALTRHYWPAAPAVALVSRRARRALVAAAVGEAVADWRIRPDLDPVRYLVAHRLDDAA
jgi:mycofactocin glycosyltransferase